MHTSVPQSKRLHTRFLLCDTAELTGEMQGQYGHQMSLRLGGCQVAVQEPCEKGVRLCVLGHARWLAEAPGLARDDIVNPRAFDAVHHVSALGDNNNHASAGSLLS
jgi:hypothetical protein